jgi:hypothetical protein
VGAGGGLTGDAATGGAGGGVVGGNGRRTTAAPAASLGGVTGNGAFSVAGAVHAPTASASRHAAHPDAEICENRAMRSLRQGAFDDKFSPPGASGLSACESAGRPRSSSKPRGAKGLRGYSALQVWTNFCYTCARW